MAFSGLDNDQTVVLCLEIKIDLLYYRSHRLYKINGDQAAYCTCHLVKKSCIQPPRCLLRIRQIQQHIFILWESAFKHPDKR